MKKITLLMALALVLTATGCGKKDVAEPTPTPEATPAPAPEATPAPETPAA